MASLPLWKVTGAFYARRNYWQSFAKLREAATAAAAQEWVVSVIGGCHHVRRPWIRIESVEPATA